MSDRLHTAVHEAGHAVVGRVLTMVCGPASIVADHDSVGHAITADPNITFSAWEDQGKFREMSSVFKGRVMTFMAGHEAEAELLGEGGVGDGHDRQQIARMIDAFCADDEHERMEARLRSRTRTVVRRHRGTIDAVSKALLARKSLTAAELDGMVPVVRPPRELPFWMLEDAERKPDE